MASDKDVFKEGISHASFNNLRPLADGRIRVSWTASIDDRKENQGAFNGFTLHSRASGESPAIEQLGNTLLASLKKSKGLAALTPSRLEKILLGYPGNVRSSFAPVLEQMTENDSQKAARIRGFLAKRDQADAEKGRELFFGKKAACSTCHKVGERGGDVGPNLSRIGQTVSYTHLTLPTILLV